MLAELVDYVIGVDPDRDRFTVAMIDAKTTGEVDAAVFRATAAGYEAAMEWADEHASSQDRVWAVEGSGSYGSGLTQTLGYAGEWVIEFGHPSGPAASDGAKTDHLDAVRAARETLGRTKWASPRARGAREGLRALNTTRDGAVRDRTRAVNELKAMLLTAPVGLRDDLAGLTTMRLVQTCAAFRLGVTRDHELFATKTAMRSLARRVLALGEEIETLTNAMRPLVDDTAPQLLDEIGIGYVVAAQLIVSFSHPGRCRDVGAFRRLAGTAPVMANSGQAQDRHRLSRGGDRQLNAALHRIALVRTCHDQRTKNYIAKRLNQGKTRREARRCLKNYIARRVYRLLENPPKQHA